MKTPTIATAKKHPAPPDPEPAPATWLDYERATVALRSLNLPHDEYQRQLRQLAEEMGL